MITKEEKRQREDKERKKNWSRFGPYLSERAWSTVREDYSPQGMTWDFFPHDHARSRVYRWGEDGLLGITDRECRLCFALALWNEKDPILKERLFGLTSLEGNHGEDVKECYYYLDSTPTHSYMKALYKYPQKAFPYDQLVEENKKRGLQKPEFELLDTHIFDGNEYYDVFVEYAKNSPNDILIKIEIANRGDKNATLHLLPTFWFRNIWLWGVPFEKCTIKPSIKQTLDGLLSIEHETLGNFFAAYDPPSEVLFTENETNEKRLFGTENKSRYVKDAFHDYLIGHKKDAINPEKKGTKCAPHYILHFAPHETKTIRLRLFSAEENVKNPLGNSFERCFHQRKKEADKFYEKKIPQDLSSDAKNISRQAFAGLLWSKQFYHYVVKDWLEGDPNTPKPPLERKKGRNHDWIHFFARDVISMPDKWEYPWFAAWDLAFHMIPFCKIDPEFAKKQMILFLREWYMHPNGQQPAYEFAFSDVNPPVHAWACWRIYKMTGKKGSRDYAFLESVFQKLLLNFTWWLNRKDREGNNIFGGGFLGLDNIGVFNRSDLPHDVHLEQADATAWMAFYCLCMLGMALELSVNNPVYEDIASKFFEHFIHIAEAINHFQGSGLWDETDGFYYDQLKMDGEKTPLRLRSLVGLIPLIAVEILTEENIKKLPGFEKRMRWFLHHRGDLQKNITSCEREQNGMRILAIPSKRRLERILTYLFSENEFLSPFGIRSLSKQYGEHPYILKLRGEEYRVDYTPGESTSYLFGGNSNWRGPIWLPLNYLIIEALERYHHFYGDELLVSFPTDSGVKMDLKTAAEELKLRLRKLFLQDSESKRAVHGADKVYADDPHFKDLLLFYEYFHADTGRGCGASHQTGWSALITKLFEK